MAQLERPDGTKIHYEVGGEEGPALVLASYWQWNPAVWKELLADLAADHRVVTYHLRGTGDSSRHGPYEMETDIGDLEAVVEEAGGPAALLATADSANRAAKLAARRPELIETGVTLGAGPFALATFEGQEGMLASNAVVDAFVETLQHNYRGGMRILIEATNPQLSEDELRERLDAQVGFCPADAALARVKAWAEDDPRAESRAIGKRLWILTAPDTAAPWLPPWEIRKRLMAETMPQANLVAIEEERGPVSQPHETANAIRRITAPLRAGAAAERK